MAIQDDNKNGNGNSNPQPAGVRPGTPIDSRTAPRPDTRGEQFEKGLQGGARPMMRLSTLNQGVRQAMSRTPASEALAKMQKALQTKFEENISPFELTLIPLDKEQTSGLFVSVLIVCAREKDDPANVAYHTLLLEASVDVVPPKMENIIGLGQVEVMRVVSDALDDKMAEEIAKAVQRQFPQATLWNADAAVVPREFPTDDSNQLHLLAANATLAAGYELDTRRPDFVDLNLNNVSKDENLIVRPAFPRTQLINATGLPLRADFGIDLTASVGNPQQNQQGLENATTVTRVNGYVDLIWNPAQPQPLSPYQRLAPQQMAMQKDYRTYSPRVVITNLDNVKMLTLPGLLLSLATALVLNENSGWMQAFRSTSYDGADASLRDIGVLAVESNLTNDPSGIGKRIDTREANFKPEDFNGLLVSTVAPDIWLSMDVPEVGAESWYLGVFAAAAGNNPRATEAIIKAANHLTDGNFGRRFAGNNRVALDENNRIHLGFYRDREGIKRDIRDIDYLAVLNRFAEQDLNVVRDWSDSFNQAQQPLIARLAGRRRIIEGFFGGSDVRFTGFARRVTFEAKFLEALVLGCADCGLNLKAQLPYMDLASYQRATPQFSGTTTLASNIGQGFFTGYGQPNYMQGQAAGANRAFGGRWY